MNNLSIIKQIMKPILLIGVLFYTFNLNAQDFSFKKDIANYKGLENFTTINDNADTFETAYNMGLNTDFNDRLNFSFFGSALDLDSVLIGKSGFAIFVTKDGSNAIAVDPFVAGIKKHDQNSKIVHGLREEGGKLYYIIEWRNVEYTEVPGKIGSFQIIIENTTGHVSFHYGPTTVPKNTTSEGIQCGLFLVTIDFTTVLQMTVIKGNPTDPSSSNASFGYLTFYPEIGTRFNFTNKVLSNGAIDQINATSTIFPNPSNGEMSIDLGKNYKEIELTITNQLGQEFIKEVHQNTRFIHCDFDLNNGLYLISLKADDKTSVKRILISND